MCAVGIDHFAGQLAGGRTVQVRTHQKVVVPHCHSRLRYRPQRTLLWEAVSSCSEAWAEAGSGEG